MLQYPSRIFFSRWERKEDSSDTDWLYTSCYTLAVAAKRIFFETFTEEDHKNWWKQWNVIELHQNHRQEPTLHFVEYELFGVHPFPKEKRRFCFYPYEKSIVELKIIDPAILHHSHKLVPKEGLGENDPLRNPKDRKRWFDRVAEIYAEMDKHNITNHPQVNCLSGLNDMLATKSLQFKNLPDNDHPTRIDGWGIDVLDLYKDAYFGDL